MEQLTRQLLESVSRPAHLARGLPNACYTDLRFFRFEQERLFARTWTAVGVASDIPGKGDVRPIVVAGQPLIMLRDRQGQVRVFHNVCRHRGMTLVTEPCRNQAVVRCPYHSWAYDLTGELKRTPMAGGPDRDDHPDFTRADKGLFPVRAAVMWDIVFVDLSGKAPDLATHLAPLSQRMKAFDMSLWRRGPAEDSVGRFELKANWKLAMENFCESYHLPWVHPNLNSYSRLEDHYHLFGDRLFAGQGTTRYAPVESGNGKFPQQPNLPVYVASGAEYYAVVPNFWIGAQCDHLFVVILEAPAPDRVIETMHLYYIGDAAEAPAYAELRAKNKRLWSQVFLEDVGVVEGMHQGRSSSAFDGGVFSPAMDTPTLHFHRMIAERLAA